MGTNTSWSAIRPQVGGLSSLASQPRAPDVMGSSDTAGVLTWPHFWHSSVQKPEVPFWCFVTSMRCRRHLGHFGRSMMAATSG